MMLNITHYQRNANQNHNEVPSHVSQNGCYQKVQIINAGEGVEKRKPSYTVGGNANQYSHYREQCGDSLKNWKQNCHMTQQSHFWAYTPRKPELNMYPNGHCSTVYNSQDMEETQMSVGRRMDKKAAVSIHNGILLSS